MVFRWYKIPVYVLLGAAFLAGVGYVTMALWNVLVPALFSGPAITFWQAVGLLILVKIFFHSFHGFHRPWHYSAYGWSSRSSYWRKRFEEKMAAMSPEDREKFREEWKRRCSYGPWDRWHRSHEPWHAHERPGDEQSSREHPGQEQSGEEQPGH